MCNPQRRLCISAETCWNHFHTFTLIYTSAVSLNKSHFYIAKFQFHTHFLNACKEMLIYVIYFDDVNKPKIFVQGEGEKNTFL
jgi:hypothetical protein